MSPYRAQLPGVRVVGDGLSAVRRSTTVALAGIEIPAAFQVATVNAAILSQARKTVSAKAARRRLLSKVERLGARDV